MCCGLPTHPGYMNQPRPGGSGQWAWWPCLGDVPVLGWHPSDLNEIWSGSSGRQGWRVHQPAWLRGCLVGSRRCKQLMVRFAGHSLQGEPSIQPEQVGLCRDRFSPHPARGQRVMNHDMTLTSSLARMGAIQQHGTLSSILPVGCAAPL